MKSSYKRLGDYIQEVNIRNKDLVTIPLLGVSIKKVLMPSIANIIGTDMSTYKLIKKNQFAYGPVTSRNGDKISIALSDEHDNAMVSQAYTVFDVNDANEVLPDYLMMWFRRTEFDRYARFMSHGSAREIFSWAELCDTLLPIPSQEKQREIVKEYKVIQNRIALNNQLIAKLEETAQTIYKQWFVDFEFPDVNGLPYKSNGGEMEWCAELEKDVPVGWRVGSINDFVENTLGGDWGKDIAQGNYNTFVKCIRGTDIPKTSICRKGSIPERYILSKNLLNRQLNLLDIVIEISGGSPIQSTGRTLLITTELKEYLNSNLICSNFCRAITPKESYSIYLHILLKYLYNNRVFFRYENSTNGVKNLNLSSLFEEEAVIVPEISTIKKFEFVTIKIINSINNYGKELDILDSLNELLLARMTKVESGMENVER